MSSRRSFRNYGRIKHRRVELRPTGVDGSAAVTKAVGTGPAIIRFIAVDYQNQPATTDLTMSEAVDGAAGDALLTLTSSNTDVTPKPVSLTAGVDEAAAALAATDGSAGGFPVAEGVFFTVAEADGQTSGDELIIVDIWYEEVQYIKVELRPVGADGSAVDARLITAEGRGAGIVRAMKIDYQNQPATTDITIKADVAGDLTGGTTVFTRTSSATDIARSPVGMAGINESGAALAATDASDGGFPFKSNLYIELAEGDGQTGGDELVFVELWIDA